MDINLRKYCHELVLVENGFCGAAFVSSVIFYSDYCLRINGWDYIEHFDKSGSQYIRYFKGNFDGYYGYVESYGQGW